MGNKRKLDDHMTSTTENRASAVADLDGPPTKKASQRRSLFVHSLAPSTTTESLISHFSQSFPIKHATAVTDPTTKLCKGYGFITFADAEDAKQALEQYNGSTFLGKKIKAEIAEPRNREIDDTLPVEIAGSVVEQRKAAAAAARALREKERMEKNRPPKLIVRNLPWSIKKPEQLQKLFLSYGKIKHVTIPNKKPGLMAGFGFVVMRGKKNAEKALEGVNGMEIDGRTLAVDWAVEKNVWEKANMDSVQEGLDEDEGGVPLYGDVADVPNIVASDEEVKSEDEEDLMLDDEDSTGEREIKDAKEDVEIDDSGEEMPDEDDQTREQDYSTTLFIRNLPFNTTDEELSAHFTKHFGRVRYARVVLDPVTERPRGTAFVSLADADATTSCLRTVPTSSRPRPGGAVSDSVLQSELDDPSGRYTLDGRILQISRAVPREQASKLASEAKVSRDAKDKRRLYLLNEGTIRASSELYNLLSQTEVGLREASAKQRRMLVQKNPALHLSLTRLSVRNIPRSVGSKELKALARAAVVGFAKDVKDGKRERLSKEELVRGGDAMIEAEKGRKRRGKGIVKQAKVVFESRDGAKVSEEIVGAGVEAAGAGRSRGYGFIEYYTHRAALMGLRWLNGHAVGYEVAGQQGKGKAKQEVRDRDRQKRLIVEFAIENAGVVKRRHDREERARERADTKDEDDPTVQKRLVHAQESIFDISNSPAGGRKPTSNKAIRTDASGRKGTVARDMTSRSAKKLPTKQAQRQRIVNKKRALRREKRKGATA